MKYFGYLLLTTGAHGFADWMTNDFCGRALIPDEIIMNNKVVTSSDRTITVTRDDKILQNGDAYVPGEILKISLSEGELTGQQVFEVNSNAKFINKGSGCNGLRSAADVSQLDISTKATEPISLVAGFNDRLSFIRYSNPNLLGWANGHEEVKLSPVFTLIYGADKGGLTEATTTAKQDSLSKLDVSRVEKKLKDLKFTSGRKQVPSENIQKSKEIFLEKNGKRGSAAKDEVATKKKINKITERIVVNPRKYDAQKLKVALRGEDITTNLLDPAIKHSHSTVTYVAIYCLVFGVLLALINVAFLRGDTSTSRHMIRRYLRQLRGKNKNMSN